LWDIPNVIITPHVAGNSEKELLNKHTVDIFTKNLHGWVSDHQLINVVDKQLQY
jgi:phosphoglycerate dehydrogenase-like enzyme